MPDQFGFETPQEALARVRERFQESQQRFAQTAGGSGTGAQLGVALSQLFASPIAKGLDTSQARKVERARLEKTGLSEEEARDLAKQNVGYDLNAVRSAKDLQKATTIAQDEMQRLTPLIGDKMAKVAGSFIVAQKLRENGMVSEANQLTSRAIALREEAANDKLAKQKAMGELKMQRQELQYKEKQTELLGKPPINELLNTREELLHEIDTTDDPAVRAESMRRLPEIQRAIKKATWITGTTEGDPAANNVITKPTRTKLEGVVIDAEDRLSSLLAVGEAFDPKYLTVYNKGLNYLRATGERFGVPLSAEGETELNDYTTFTSTAMAGLNSYIKYITGAAMSELEVPRIKKAYPNPDEDSATQFVSKYVATVRAALGVKERARRGMELGITDPDTLVDRLGSYDDYMPPESAVRDMLGFSTAQQIIDSASGKAAADSGGVVIGTPRRVGGN